MITLAIPNRNSARFLTETLNSLDRNRPHVRWWFQDSLSTDESVTIARTFLGANDHIEVEKDNCQPDGLNRAIGKMGGDIIGFLNSDDCLTDGAAERVLREFAEDPELDMVIGEVEWIDEHSAVVGHHAGCITSLEQVLDIYKVWWKQRQWVQPEVFYRRRVWERVGAFNTKLDLAFDYEYWVRCWIAGVKVKHIPQVLVQFRRHSGQKSMQAAAAAAEIRDVVKKVLAENLITPATGRRIGRLLRYDRYQSGQDWPGATRRPSLAYMLLRNPGWVMLPEVRDRLWRSLASPR